MFLFFSLFLCFYCFPAQCNSIAFGFGSENDEYTLPCSLGYIGNITVRCQPSGWHILEEMCVLSELEELKKVKQKKGISTLQTCPAFEFHSGCLQWTLLGVGNMYQFVSLVRCRWRQTLGNPGSVSMSSEPKWQLRMSEMSDWMVFRGGCCRGVNQCGGGLL